MQILRTRSGNYSAAIAITALIACYSAPALADLSPRGRINQVSGQVILKSQGSSTVVVKPEALSAGDVVITIDGSQASINHDGCKIELAANSIYTIRAYSSCKSAKKNVLAMDTSFMPEPVKITTPQPAKEKKKATSKKVDEPTVMLPRGTWIVSPSVSYSHSTATNVDIQGLSVLPALAVGLVEVSEVQRNTFSTSINIRTGLSRRFELGMSIPFAYRDETSRVREITSTDQGDPTNSTTGSGIGDIGFSIRTQIGKFTPGKPYYTGSLKVKTRTGTDSFEVKRDEVVKYDSDGNREVLGSTLLEQPNGSGFWGVQGALTTIIPSDPSVIFAGVSYFANLERDIGGTVGIVDPGDTVGFNVGTVFNLNPRTQFGLSYGQQITFKTRTQVDTTETTFDETITGTLGVKLNYITMGGRSIACDLGIGTTDQSTDLSLGVSTSFEF